VIQGNIVGLTSFNSTSDSHGISQPESGMSAGMAINTAHKVRAANETS
jgi:hypothetical protein